MKNVFRFTLLSVAVAAFGALSVACDNGSGNGADPSAQGVREQMLQRAAVDFVDKTVIPVYRELADAGIELTEACEAMQDAFAQKRLTTPLVQAACDKWIEARKYWELSEAFLYGAAGDYNIDPHIDSWPLNRSELEALLNDPVRMGKMDDDYAGTYLGYGLLGFHALEYMLFENAGPRELAKYTTEELVFTVAVAGDLRNQCVRLEAAWAGLGKVTEEKQQLLSDAELEPTFDYGASMMGAGEAGSKYKNYLEAAQEILQGCIDIADEVANQKIGRPANGTSDDDVNYIESPYSQNSKTDFIDNIRSIRNTYLGTNADDSSVSDYVQLVDAELDASVRAAIEAAIKGIEACEAPFVDNRTSQRWKAAVGICNDLLEVLEQAQQALMK